MLKRPSHQEKQHFWQKLPAKVCRHGPSDELPITKQPSEEHLQQSTGRHGSLRPGGSFAHGLPARR